MAINRSVVVENTDPIRAQLMDLANRLKLIATSPVLGVELLSGGLSMGTLNNVDGTTELTITSDMKLKLIDAFNKKGNT